MDYLTSRWQQHFGEFDNREIWQWAAEEGELPSAYSVTGRLDVTTCPMIKGPLGALKQRIVRHVVSMAGVQCLKTLIGELWLLWSIVHDPGAAQWLQCTDQEAKEHCLERFMQLLNNFPVIKKYLTANRHDKTSTFIRFAHMFLRMEGAETKSNLQRKSIKLQMRSEVWQARYWPPGTLKEADSRLTQFVHNSKKYTESQAGDDAELETDDMHAAYLSGDQNVWQFPCQGCGKFQPFLWSHIRADGTRAAMRWDDTERTRRENGEWRWQELLPTIRYECIHCGHRHHDEPLTRRRLTDGGKFVAQHPDAPADTKSFTWNQLAMPQLSWFKSETGGVFNFLQAHESAKRGFDKKLREFFQKVLAEPYHPAKHGLFHRTETIELQNAERGMRNAEPIVHDGVTFSHRMMGVDVQADHFWLLVEIWSANGDSLTLHAEKVFTWADVAERQKGFHVPDENVMVDQSHRGHEVVVECTRHGYWGFDQRKRRVWACWNPLRGSDQDHFYWQPPAKPGKPRSPRIALPYSWPPAVGDPCSGLPSKDPRRGEFQGRTCAIFTWSNPTVKDVVIRRREGHARGIKSLCVTADWNDEFSRQMHSQKKVFVRGNYGSGKWKWEAFRDDHLFDAKCMVVVRAFQLHLIGPNAEAEEGQDANSTNLHE